MTKLKEFLTLSINLLTLTFSHSSFSQTANNISANSTGFAGAIIGTATHSPNTKVFLLCNAGTTSGEQLCVIYIQMVAGVKGQINTVNNSTVSLAFNSIVASSSSGSYVTAPNINVNTTNDQPGGFVISQPTPNASTAVSLAGVTQIPGNKAGLNLDQANGMTAVKCRVFNGNTVPDAKWVSSAYAASLGETTQDIVKVDGSNEALFLLSGFHNNTLFNRATIGYADQFTINYTLTVASSTAESSQTCP